MVLTDNVKLRHRITHPAHKLGKSYWVQVEGIPNEHALDLLRSGVILNDGKTKPAIVLVISEPSVWARNPPIRFRKNIPTTWLEITLTEGRNRQIRRMCASVDHPTLRLIRFAIGDWKLGDLAPGEWRYALPTKA